ncbi:hypothetical protein B0O80DRAFT_441345 [Mortierella sp. GBAus27b]|nr:hypothetical protein B0O80DRAFT_441345 [Mortierella sp. GBAus27b]
MAADVKQTIAGDCHALEKTATALISVPHVAARGVHKGLVTALNMALSQMGNGLEAVVDGILAIIEFVISMQTGTWRCFLDHLATSGIPFLSSVGGEGVQAIDTLEKALVDLLALPLRGLGGVIKEKMGNPQIGGVVNTQAMSIQTVEFCQKALNLETVDRLALDFKRWILYGSIALVAVAFVATLGNMGLITFQYKRWQAYVERMRDKFVDMPDRVYAETVTRENSDDPAQSTAITTTTTTPDNETAYTEEYKLYTLRISYMANQPLVFRFVDRTAQTFFPGNKTAQHLYFWFMFYITHPPALMCLLVGILGITLTFTQIAVIEQVRSNYAPMLASAIGNISNMMLDLINNVIRDTSVAFAKATNEQLQAVETDLNTNVFGGIVSAASNVSTALATVQDTLMQGVQSAFGTALFGKLVIAVLQCLLLNKLAIVESGLVWVQEKAHITLPRLEDDVLMMDKVDVDKFVSAAVNSNSTGTEGGGAGGVAAGALQLIGHALDKIFTAYQRELGRSLPVYYALVAVWGSILLMGLVGAGIHYVVHRRKSQCDWYE